MVNYRLLVVVLVVVGGVVTGVAFVPFTSGTETQSDDSSPLTGEPPSAESSLSSGSPLSVDRPAPGSLASPATVTASANTQSTADSGPTENDSSWVPFDAKTVGTGSTTVTADYLVQVVDDSTTLRVRYRSNGSLHGTFDTGSSYGGIVGSAAVHDGVAYFGVGRTLYAVSLSTMTEVWNTTFDSREIWGTPTYADGVIYTGAGDAYAVHASNGSTKWRFDVGEYRLSRQPAVVGDQAYLVDDVGELHVVDAATGTELWNVSASTVNTVANSQPAVRDGDVYVALDGTLYRLDQNGTTVWTYDLSGPSGGIAVDDTHVYATTTAGTVEAVSRDHGYEEWTYTDPEGGAFVNDQKGAPFTTGNGLVYVSVLHFDTRNGSAVALDATNGSEVWRFDTDSMLGDDVAYHDNAVYVNDGTGVRVFDGSTT